MSHVWKKDSKRFDDAFAAATGRMFDDDPDQRALNDEIEAFAVTRHGANWNAFLSFAQVENDFAMSLPVGDWRRSTIIGEGN